MPLGGADAGIHSAGHHLHIQRRIGYNRRASDESGERALEDRLMRRAAWAGLIGLMAIGAAEGQANAVARLPGLKRGVDVATDEHGIPHIFANNWEDAARVLGYLHARDRILEMELFRRQASGTLAELLGPGALESDTLMRRLGIRRGCEEFWRAGNPPADFRAEFEAYAGGVNARLEEIKTSGNPAPGVPAPFDRMIALLPPWTPVDSLVFGKYMGWDQSGTTDDLWLGQVVEKFGIDAVQELWPLERPYEVPIVARQAPQPRAGAAALRAPGGIVPCGAGNGAVYATLLERLERARWLPRGDHFGSNNWAVAGSKSASGKPILASDPHLGFKLPSIWYACHLAVKGQTVTGAGFPGNPGIIIGHTDHHGWGVTNMQADAVDFFVETVKPDDPTRYLHKGEWKPFERRVEKIAVQGAEPKDLVIESTVHGPVIQRDGVVIAMAWTGLGASGDALAFWGASRAKNLPEFLAALDHLVVPALNVVYADSAGNIALHPCGALPLRAPGSGRIPMDGSSGELDWGPMIPRAELPFAHQPESGFVASANNRPTPLGFPFYVGWMWDPSYRARRIHAMLAGAQGLTIESMAPIQNDVLDLAAARFLPAMLEGVPESALQTDPERQARRILAEWNYVAELESLAPAIWLRWLPLYRSAVWEDEFQARGVKNPGGSWGFSGNNRREPVLELLEFITREQPNSRWFDDKKTPQRETRDDIALATFRAGVASLSIEFGPPAKWIWKERQWLELAPMLPIPALGRKGGPIPGTEFTVNPGGSGGGEGGGASWRMLVDFGAPERSLGVYPGGQSADPTSPRYDDLVKLWERGQYVPLRGVKSLDRLGADARITKARFEPGP